MSQGDRQKPWQCFLHDGLPSTKSFRHQESDLQNRFITSRYRASMRYRHVDIYHIWGRGWGQDSTVAETAEVTNTTTIELGLYED